MYGPTHEGPLLLNAPCKSPHIASLFLVHLFFPCISIHEGSLLLSAPRMSPHIASFFSCISSFRASPYMKALSFQVPHVWAHTLLPFSRASLLSVHLHSWRLSPFKCPMSEPTHCFLFSRASLLSVHLHAWRLSPFKRPTYEPTHCFLFLVHLFFPCISIHEGSLLSSAPCLSPHIASFFSCISSFRASPYMKALSFEVPHVWAHTLLPFSRASLLSMHLHTWRLSRLKCPMYEPTHCFLFLVHLFFPCISLIEYMIFFLRAEGTQVIVTKI